MGANPLHRLSPMSPSGNKTSLVLLPLALIVLALSACGGGGGGGSAPAPQPPPPDPNCNEGMVSGPTIPLNPLQGEQWYLVNVGQSAFASCLGAAGQDINLAQPPAITGAGVKVAVLDTGLEILHPDLAANVVAGSYNFVNLSSDPTNPTTTGDHGTSVAGLIAMVADNSIGGRGVASGASLVGYNFLQTGTNPDLISSLGTSGVPPDSSTVHVFNQSFGIPTTNDIQINAGVESQLISGVNTLRGGLGGLYVKSAGNGFDGYGGGWLCTPGITCENANFDPNNAVPWNIIVGAMDAGGLKSSYSTAGSTLWVGAPGGEFGYDVNQGWAPWPTNPSKIFEPAMVTTDQTGCTDGYSRTDPSPSPLPKNAFEDGDPTLNPNCDYTSTFNGTSSAAPVTVGVVALLLEANTGLTWRDVKHILATTADSSVDSGAGGAGQISTTLSNGSYEAEPGWVTNAVGKRFSNWYGFGRVDADAAVAMALGGGGFTPNSWPALIDTGYTTSGAISLGIPDNSIAGVPHTIDLTLAGSGISFIEAVQIKVSISHTYTGDLGIELASPGGLARSILFTMYSGFDSSDNLAGMVLLSNAFYGETVADGTWTIKVVDGFAGDVGTLTNWQIRIYGH